MLPSQVQHQLFGEIKSKPQPSFAPFGHNNLFFIIRQFIKVLLETPNGPQNINSDNSFQERSSQKATTLYTKAMVVFSLKGRAGCIILLYSKYVWDFVFDGQGGVNKTRLSIHIL